jgi:D-serine deaminase-like pyridoxal phosphate-dependent protein
LPASFQEKKDMADRQELIGKTLNQLETPALVVDADALKFNLDTMASYFVRRSCKLRPHFKSHKCVTLAHRQLKAGGAVGITTAKLSEAEALVAGGVTDVLIANQVVGAGKCRRLAELNRRAVVRSAVDSPQNLRELSAAAQEAGVTIGVLVEVDIGMNRCGVPPGEPTFDLARRVNETKGLRFDGLQGYEGHLVLMPDAQERVRRTRECIRGLVALRPELEKRGLPCAIISGGGTGTYDVTGNIEGMNEVQAGSYALMDKRYRETRPEFRNAMSVLATVISAQPDHVVCDVGLKGVGSDFGVPAVLGHPEAEVRPLAEEHASVKNVSAKIGDRLQLIPSHGCTTSNLHRRMIVARGDVIEGVWPIEGSGCLE